MKNLLQEVRELGVKLEYTGENLKIIAPSGILSEDIQNRIKMHKSELVELLKARSENDTKVAAIKHDAENLYQSFSATDIQHAYWLGRDQSISLGNVATHVYLEMEDADLDVDRLIQSLNALIKRHDMLRAVFDKNGDQKILQNVPEYVIVTKNMADCTDEELDLNIDALRDELSHQVFKPDQWPLFDIRATLLPKKRVRLHLSIDMLIMDGASFGIFFTEWRKLYDDPNALLPKLGVSFRDYVCELENLQTTESYKRAEQYWAQRIDTIPTAPQLPLKSEKRESANLRFTRKEIRIGKDKWNKLKSVAKSHGITPTTLLMAAYSEVLAKWSDKSHFTLNVISANRKPLHADINNLVGVFTSVILQEVNRDDVNESFIEFANQLQKQSARDVGHQEYSGLRVMREWAKRRGLGMQAVMPVVFNSTLGARKDNSEAQLSLGEQVYGSSQTSQVYLENHVSEYNGDLHISWDAIEEVFEDGVLEHMFDSYLRLLDDLFNDEGLWQEQNPVALPEQMWKLREDANNTETKTELTRLHAGFVRNALDNPSQVAVISEERTLTYEQLLHESCALANWLVDSGVRAGEPVAIVMKKGWEQIVAVYGILLAGAAYMPVNSDLPVKRKQELLKIGKVEQVIVQADTDAVELIENNANLKEDNVYRVTPGQKGSYNEALMRSLAGSLDELAYVIFTSGTTGVPKGVMIDHKGAINTIKNINAMFRVSSVDRVLAVSSLSFDLSVYDVFGMHEAGGALVIPTASRGHDPQHWTDLVTRFDVTLWNSAPQLMGMLVDELEETHNTDIAINKVMMSGDWIPLNLPNRIKSIQGNCQVISLGGATEASIWSNYHVVDKIAEEWKSIPYGKPLPNQTMWVFDKHYSACPDYVVGDIYIGGIGVAMGYWGDEKLTNEKFITHPKTGERYYKTGDLGQYGSDGNIFILGRSDRQVKLRGYRIELDEIESIINSHPNVKQALVTVVKEAGKSKLASYVQASDSNCDKNLLIENLKSYLYERLPDYMVPQQYLTLKHLPLSSNGKIDYKALDSMVETVVEEEVEVAGPTSDIEERILSVWLKVLGDEKIGVNDSFFEFGGDSITAAKMVRELNAEFSEDLEIHEFFENPTVEMQAKLFESRKTGCDSLKGALVLNRELLLQDINRANTLINSVVLSNENKVDNNAVLLTGASGWVGSHMLHELLHSTSVTIYCLMRNTKEAGISSESEHKNHLRSTMSKYGLAVDSLDMDRIKVVPGDINQPKLGLSGQNWALISEKVDRIYHLAANLNLGNDYVEARKSNVVPMLDVVRLAAEKCTKEIVLLSPMNVCMRLKNGAVDVNAKETPIDSPDGLLTGYSQSKWVSEQILMKALEKGIPVKVFRTSHALPSTVSGYCKPGDTFVSLLRLACSVDSLPNWDDGHVHGLPVDRLAKLVVKHGQDGAFKGIVHADNANSASFVSVVKELKGGHEIRNIYETKDFEEWKSECRAKAEDLNTDSANLAKILVIEHGERKAPVDHMFGGHKIECIYLDEIGETTDNKASVSSEYWRRIAQSSSWISY